MGQRANEVGQEYTYDETANRDAFARADDSASEDTEQIRAEIEQTRADMSETLEALQERLSPSHLKEQAQEQFVEIKDHVREQVREQFIEAKQMVRDATIGRVEHFMSRAGDTAYEARGTIGETIRQNPIPAALVGLGLGWLFMNRRSAPPRYSGRGSGRGSLMYDQGQRTYADRPDYYQQGVGYYERQGNAGYTGDYNRSGSMDQGRGMVGQAVDRAQGAVSNVASTVSGTASNVASTVSDTASNVASTVSDTASNVASTVSDTASNVVDRAQYQYERVEDRVGDALQNNPLAVGAVVLALGTAVGLALPQTERENRLMGETRDQIVDRAQDVAQDTLHKVQQVAGDVLDETKTTVKEQAREKGLTS